MSSDWWEIGKKIYRRPVAERCGNREIVRDAGNNSRKCFENNELRIGQVASIGGLGCRAGEIGGATLSRINKYPNPTGSTQGQSHLST